MPHEDVIITLSTIPPRFEKIQPVLDSLLKQSVVAKEINLYIPKTYKRFGSYDINRLVVPENISIKIIEDDLGPATKILPCVREHRNEDVFIVYCDDDRLYAPTWLENLVDELRQRPGHVITASGAQLDQNYQISREAPVFTPRAVKKRVKDDRTYLSKRFVQFMRRACGFHAPKPHRNIYERGGYVDFAMGVGGVALRPDDIPKIAFDIPDIAWPVDDMWLSGCLALNSVRIWASENVPMPTAAKASDIESLANSTFDGLDRHKNDLACIHYLRETYGIWR
jgi:hypothetical protein